MGHQDTDTGEVVFSEETPERLVEPTDSVIGIGGRFTVGDPVEKMAIVRTLQPHPLHLRRTWLEVSEILFAKARFLVDLDRVSGEGRWRGGIGGQR